MHRLAAACVVAALAPGCITTYGVYKHQQDVSRTDIVTAGALDLGGLTAFLWMAESKTIPISFLIGLGTTAVDLGVACMLGTCKSLHQESTAMGSAAPPPPSPLAPPDGPDDRR